MSVHFPNESPEYREARRRLLQREIALRREMETVAAEIRGLPPGGEIPKDYEFDHVGADGTAGEGAAVRAVPPRDERPDRLPLHVSAAPQ